MPSLDEATKPRDLSSMKLVPPSEPAYGPSPLPIWPPTPNPAIRSPLAPGQVLQPDALRQFYSPILPQTRISPMPPASNTAQNASALTQAISVQAPAAASAVVAGTLIWRGDWSSSTAYAVDDVVLFNRTAYVALIASTNVEPDTSADIDFGQAEATWAVLGENLNLRGTFDNSTAFGTAQYVQSRIASFASGVAGDLAFNSPNAAHNCILVWVFSANVNATASTITDSNNSYALVCQTVTTDNNWAALYIAQDIAAGANTVHIAPSPTGGPGDQIMIISEWSSVPTSGVIDNFNNEGLSTTQAPLIPISTSDDNELVVLFVGERIINGGDTGTKPTGYTEFEFLAGGNEYKAGAHGVRTTHGTFNSGYSFSSPPQDYFLIVASIKGQINTILYHPYDAILFNGSAYLCIVPTSLSPADEPTSWRLLASGVASGGVNKQTGSYLAVTADSGKILAFNIAAPATLTLPAVSPSTTWFTTVENYGTATLTVSPNGLNLDGSASSISVFPNQGLLIYTDGTNYFSERGMSSGGIRHTTLFTTVGTLDPQQVESGTWSIAKSFVVLILTVGSPARVRLYSTTAFRDADVSRPPTTSPTPGAQNGVIMDVVLTAATGLTWVMSPSAWGSNGSGTPTSTIGFNVTNLDTISEQVQVTLTYVTEE